jgi:hypothetical protein
MLKSKTQPLAALAQNVASSVYSSSPLGPSTRTAPNAGAHLFWRRGQRSAGIPDGAVKAHELIGGRLLVFE